MTEPDTNGATPLRSESLAPIFMRIRLAASFLTIIPLVDEHACAADEVAASFGWFPLIGFIIGAALAFEDYVLAFFIGHALRAVIIVMTLEIATGGVHLDGLADTADALGAGRDRQRALDIMRDSRIGSFGAAALFFVLALKVLAIAGTGGGFRYGAIYAAPGLARWSMVAVSYGLNYVRSGGAGATLLAGDERRNLPLASLIAAVAMLPVIGYHALRACVVAVLLTLIMRAFYRRWIDGVTGDLIGAAGEIVEAAILIAITN
jgi:adenosylcobinamide-GDP ribazoletransferase